LEAITNTAHYVETRLGKAWQATNSLPLSLSLKYLVILHQAVHRYRINPIVWLKIEDFGH